MVEYWLCRREQALQNSREAETVELRDVYLRVAAHCHALENWCFATSGNSEEDMAQARSEQRRDICSFER